VLWYLRTSESLLVWFKPASLTALYHEEALRVSSYVNYSGYRVEKSSEEEELMTS
jgi:hypothetical protein